MLVFVSAITTVDVSAESSATALASRIVGYVVEPAKAKRKASLCYSKGSHCQDSLVGLTFSFQLI